MNTGKKGKQRNHLHNRLFKKRGAQLSLCLCKSRTTSFVPSFVCQTQLVPSTSVYDWSSILFDDSRIKISNNILNLLLMLTMMLLTFILRRWSKIVWKKSQISRPFMYLFNYFLFHYLVITINGRSLFVWLRFALYCKKIFKTFTRFLNYYH